MKDRKPENAPEASIIVLAHGEEMVLTRCLESLKKQETTCSFEVIAVCSGAGRAARLVERLFPDVRLVVSSQRLSPPQARNAGLRAARGRTIAFLAADCTVPSGWLSRRMRLHREGHDCVGGSVRSLGGIHPISLSEHWIEYSTYLLKNAPGFVEGEVPHTLSYARRIFADFGTFDERLDRGEDTLFNSRLIKAGVRVYYDPAVVLFHRGSTAPGRFLAHQFEHGLALARLRDLEGGGWAERSSLRKLLSLFPVFLFRRMLATYRRIFLGQPLLGPLAVLYAPLILAGMISISAGACLELISSGASSKNT